MNEQYIAGYRVVRRLGGGGMGEVFLVEHPRLPRQDALKLLHSSVSSNPQYKARFEREAYLLAQLNHRNIIHLYDRGEHDGRLWIAMEYVAGPDTAQLLAERGPMPLPLAIEIADGAGAGLDYAYRHANITHRDVKPANILVAFDADGQPQVKLADFGIAKAAGEALGVTSTGVTVGTMAYMSPEAFDNRNLDNRADLYSLACTVFELLTGSPPFPGDSTAAVISAHLNQPVPKITSRNPRLPAHLDLVFRKALAKRPDDRYSTCAEFVAGLRGEIPAMPAQGGTAEHPSPSTGAYPAPRTGGQPTGSYGPPTGGYAPRHTAPQPAPTRAEAMPPATAAQPYPAEQSPDRYPPAEYRGDTKPRKRSLPIVVGALVVIVALVVGGFFLFKETSGGGTSSGSPLTATSVQLVNFQGTNDSSPNIRNVLTGATPAWKTDQYFSGPQFGGLKSGVGLLITLDREASITSGTITSPSAGSTVQVRTAQSSSVSSLDQTSTVWEGTLNSGDTAFAAGGSDKTRYVLVWITGLAQVAGGKWQTTIEQVQVRGN
ncbi:non-specific serine/threonine protein kinase OS=Tsukamurella paurometabola (strain ATCC 8368 / DSM / CCUG 35730 / CIP 100753 / JCM 10117 / KCTC 9821 / NBRC 16120 / NCIMB 702349 / NCTC 13040) OX=521096 GN=Tpau_3873 PE=4 SV=1 [Tsukamurella paurometabola]|uniref:non-specific serine/threonine protein kinase n=2 Tax=Tsukamurella paurometabola TaxID=2061 RepID=D5UMH4_TSUPD|nr:serine/threonine protein kinase [Tsukamurella paurometabola DSM 20162]SUP39677.1 Serine/threonine-protein kinase pknF [Tsukamurella paurometabola]